MKLSQFPLRLAILLASIAGAASSYKVTLPLDVMVGETPLKAGEYTLTLEGKVATLKKGKVSVEFSFVVDKNEKKFFETVLETTGNKLEAIDLGGTNIKVVFRASH
jgi:hypothetical protein